MSALTINYKKIGKRIRSIRKRRNISQLQLSEMINRSAPFMSYIESGTRSLGLETLIDIANALSVTSDELLQDHLDNTIVVSNHAFSSVLHDCSEYEKQVLLGAIIAIKDALRQNKHLFIR